MGLTCGIVPGPSLRPAHSPSLEEDCEAASGVHFGGIPREGAHAEWGVRAHCSEWLARVLLSRSTSATWPGPYTSYSAASSVQPPQLERAEAKWPDSY